jgi:peptidoglycan hydrolase-like protein with peptidoglycan-binding domain
VLQVPGNHNIAVYIFKLSNFLKMGLLKKGQTGNDVLELQNILQELDYDIDLTGVYDVPTFKAVRDFQSSHVDIHGQPLTVDGSVGALTMWALEHPRINVSATHAFDFTKMPEEVNGESPVGRKALEIAIEELNAGAGEIGGNNKGIWVKKYLKPVGLGEGQPWCAGFVSWCFQESATRTGTSSPFKYSAGARNIYHQLRTMGKTVDLTSNGDQAKPGDIVAWWRTSMSSGKGHIGIVHHEADGFIYTIEGNKAANVAGFCYVKTRMEKLLGFARTV